MTKKIATPPLPSRASPSATVLVIEDEESTLGFVARVLELEHHRVIMAGDGLTGVQLLNERHIDLVLLDLRLPVLDGWTVLRELKARPELADIPVVVFTAIADLSEHRKVLEMGASVYLTKPVRARHLSKVVNSLIHDRRRKASSRTA